MRLMDNPQYVNGLRQMYQDFPHWDRLNGKTVFISGVSGMLGSLLTDAVMLRNESLPAGSKCRIIGMGRNKAAAEKRFERWMGSEAFTFIEHDISAPLLPLPLEPDYWIHAASTTHPVAYATEPVNTILANVLGARNILDAAARIKHGRVLLLSSVEIYGENRGDTEYFTEGYCGYLNCNTLRAGYPEAKRVSEALCQAYMAERGTDAVIIRLPRCYSPTMKPEDTKAIAQFIRNGIQGKDIVLKSKGEQLYSFAHGADAVCGILWALLCGETGQAYNLGSRQSDIMQKDLARLIADYAGTNVVFDLPGETERRGYSTATKAVLDGSKLEALGWRAKYDIATGIHSVMDILREECETCCQSN